MSTTYRFARCTVEVDDEARIVRTTFPDGHSTVASPVVDPESVARARALGYAGSDEDAVWEMTRWHDLLHTIVADAEGYPWSPTLRAVSRGDPPIPGVAAREERIVLLLQRMLAEGIAGILGEHSGGEGSS